MEWCLSWFKVPPRHVEERRDARAVEWGALEKH